MEEKKSRNMFEVGLCIIQPSQFKDEKKNIR